MKKNGPHTQIMDVALVLSSAALAYQYTRMSNQRKALGIVSKRDNEFHDGGDFAPDYAIQEPLYRKHGDPRKRGDINTIYTDQLNEYRSELPIGTLNLRASGYRPLWTEQDQPPRQTPQEYVQDLDNSAVTRTDVAATRRDNLTDNAIRHLRSNLRTQDGVPDDQIRVAPPVRGGPRRDSDILRPRYDAFNFGEDLTVIEQDQFVRGHHVGSAKPNLIRQDQGHEVRADRAMEMQGVGRAQGTGLLPGGGSFRGRMASSGQSLPTLQWDWGRSGNRAPVLSAGANSRDDFVEETRGMNVDSHAASMGSSKGTQHQQRGAMRNAHTFGLRMLLDLPSKMLGGNRAPAVSTTAATPASQLTGPLVDAPQKPAAAPNTSTQKRPAALSTGFGNATNRRPDLPTVNASTKKPSTFKGMSAAPAAQVSGPNILDLPPPIIGRQHNVGQSTAVAPTRGEVATALLTEDVHTLPTQAGAGARSNQLRLNRTDESITLTDELDTERLTAPRANALPYTRPISTLVPGINAAREQGEFRRR